MGISSFFNKNSNLINLLVVAPCLFFVDFSYQKFAIIALVLGFLILIQNLFLINYKCTSNENKKKHWYHLLTNFMFIIFLVPLCLYQFINPSFNGYNKFAAVCLFLNSSMKFLLKKKYEKFESLNVINNIKNYNNKHKKHYSSSENICNVKSSSSCSHSSSSSSSSSCTSSSSCVSTNQAKNICNKYNIKSD
jgi:hypothetical protein